MWWNVIHHNPELLIVGRVVEQKGERPSIIVPQSPYLDVSYDLRVL